jgi:predicted ATP-grasp superfamily ATP-dependent carboligase
VAVSAASDGRFDALVLDLDTRAGLAITRTLAGAGLRVAGAAQDPSASGFRTRRLSARVPLPDAATDFRAFGDAILDFLRAHPTDAVLTSIDSCIEAMHERRDEFSAVTAPALGAPEAVDVAISKPRTLEVAASLGVPVPRSIHVTSSDELRAALGEIGVPAVVKPDESWVHEGAGGARVGPVLATRLDALYEGPALVQEVAPGVRETIKLFRDRGRVLARLAMRVDRSWPLLGGSSVMRTSIEPPADALAHAERLVAEIGLDGYSEVEFRRAADGRPLLMEVNPRLSQSIELALRAGVDFARMQLEWARGGTIPVPDGYRRGVRLGWVAGDVRVVAASPRSLPAVARDYVRGTRLEGLDVRDPAPLAGALAFTARSLRRRGTRRPSA